MPVNFQVIDGDGHVMEDDSLKDFIQAPYLGARRMLGGLAVCNATSRDWSIALARAYNDWLRAVYLDVDSRFEGMALLPLADVPAAVEELRRAVGELGMRGAILPSSGLRGSLGNREYWPVYEEAARLGCALAVHGGMHLGMGLDHMDSYPAIHAIAHPFGLMRACSSLVFNGLFDRFPGLKIGFLEGGVSWLTVCLERFDRSYATHTPFNPRGDVLRLEPGQQVSSYVRALIDGHRLFVGCEGEEPGIAPMVRSIGNKGFMFSSDFPHEVNADMCRRELEEIKEHPELSDTDRRAILSANAIAFYGL
jgi:predicted TIM-barrel fold metal-dependent hydrolase